METIEEQACRLEALGWQPIETLPKDRTVDLWVGNDPSLRSTPTHWRPIPDAPKDEVSA